jgi:hypothetical protein
MGDILGLYLLVLPPILFGSTSHNLKYIKQTIIGGSLLWLPVPIIATAYSVDYTDNLCAYRMSLVYNQKDKS